MINIPISYNYEYKESARIARIKEVFTAEEMYPAFMSGTLNVSELARVCGLSRPTVYKYLRLVG